MNTAGGRFYWAREVTKPKGIIVIFAWVSIGDAQLKDFIGLYSSLGFNSLVCRSDYLNLFFPERATSLAFSLLGELVKELRCGLCPVVFASFSGGSKACMYKVLQIIEGCADVELSMEDNRLVASCISGQIYDSDPIEFTTDLGARFSLHPSILKIPGSSKIVSLFAKGVTSSLDALFITRFGSQRADYWKILYSSVSLGTPFLILCSENDEVAPYSTLLKFAQRIQVLGGNVKAVKWSDYDHVGHHSKCQSVQYTAAVTKLLERATLIFSEKIRKLGEQSSMDNINMHDEISDLIWVLQNAAVDSCQSFRRVAVGPNDHFFLPSSSPYQSTRECGPTQQDRKERTSPHRLSANSVLGQALFDACVPKNIECWDIKFSGSLNGEPLASIRKRPQVRGFTLKSRL